MNLHTYSLTLTTFMVLVAPAPPAAAGDSPLSSPIELAQSDAPAQSGF